MLTSLTAVQPRSINVWRSMVRAYVQWCPIERGKRFVMDTCAPLYEGSDELVCELPGGARIRVDLREHVQRRIYFFGAYELETVAWFRSVLQPGWTFLDIGAHVGQYSLIAAEAVGSTGRVHAFEPNAASFRRLTENIELNGYGHATAHNVALSNTAGEATLFVPTDNNMGEASLQRCVESDITTVRMMPADDWMDTTELQWVDLIKIDVQGFERRVLEGAQRLIAKFKPVILCEFEERWLRLAGTSSVELKRFASDMGYSVNRIGPTRLTPVDPSEVHSFDNLVLIPR